ncbi:UNVERIFIED_CONTAM: hypothetical protein HDU68_012412 [Siphonaria sp. JEL0065]|nr:hypothetical protein HDU68_012412 [Siphonaria sp. JEL0065]
MVRNYGWKISESELQGRGEDPMTKAFKGFGNLIKDRIRECLRDPAKFKMVIQEFEPDHLLSLSFIEVVSGYRNVILLTLEFVPSPWSEVVHDIRMDYERTRAHYSNVHNALVQSLDIVSKYQPSILLTGGVPDPLQPEQVQSWKDLVRDLLIPTTDKNSGRILTSDEKMMRAKMFVLLTLPKEETLEPVLSKSMEIQIQGYHGDSKQIENVRVTFTFYAKRHKNGPPSSYIIIIHTPQDIFLNFTSQEITPSVFHTMTSKINISSNHDNNLTSTTPHLKYQASQAFGSRRDEKAYEERRKGRAAVFGFHPGEGLGGGVVGVLVDDFLKGVEDDPGRYRVCLRVKNRASILELETEAKTNQGRGSKSKSSGKENFDDREAESVGLEWLMQDPTHQGRGIRAVGIKPPTQKDVENVHNKISSKIYELHGLTSQNPPDLRTAKLVFTENVMFRQKEVLEILFTETARENMQKEVRDRYDGLKTEIDWVQHRLDVLYDTVRRKNPSLMATLGTIPVPRSFFGRPTIASRIIQETKTEFKVPILEPPTIDRPSHLESPTRIRGTNRPVIVVTNPIVSKEVIHDMKNPYRVDIQKSREAGGRYNELTLNPHIVMGPWSPSKIPVQPIKEKAKPKRRVTTKVYDVHGGMSRVRSRSNSPSRASNRSPFLGVHIPRIDEPTETIFETFILSEINLTKRAVGKPEISGKTSRPASVLMKESRPGSRFNVRSVSQMSSRHAKSPQQNRISHHELRTPTPSIRPWPQVDSPLSRASH